MPGGVCAVLDYEVELMAEYVAEMATRVVTPEASVTSPFRKFVTQILTSTRLPSTTILLGMNYLAKRINSMKSQGPYKASEGQVWRYLTVSLLLGSKFLDDNTFQNRSWSEVSGISVAELNSLEFDWVQAMSWRLYVNLDLSKDYQAWLENWRDWQQMKKRQAAQAAQVAQVGRERLASLVPAIDTDVARFGNGNGNSNGVKSCSPNARYIQAQIAEYERYQAVKARQNPYRPQDSSAWANNPWNGPLTPPDSGYGTPEYSLSATSSNARYNEWFAQATAQYASRYPQPPARSNFYSGRQASYPSHYQYQQHNWEHVVGECACTNCAEPMKPTSFFMSQGYGQPVIG